MRPAAALLLLASATSQGFACAGASVGNYDFAPGLGVRTSGTEVLDYFIGHLVSLRLDGSTQAFQPGGSVGQAEIRVLRAYGAQNGTLEGTMTFLVARAGCAGINLAEGGFHVFGTYRKDGKRYIAGWPGPW